jgi:hypothetical protein
VKIKFIFSDEKDLHKVEQRFYAVAEAHGLSRDEALREALLFWLHMVPEGSDFTLDVTDAEWKELRPEIARVRERHRAEGGPEPSSEGTAS